MDERDEALRLLLQAGYVVGRRLGKLNAAERERLAKLVRESGGRVSTLSEKERKELRKLAAVPASPN